MQNTIRDFFYDFRLTIQKLMVSVPFIRKHRIWEGFWRYSWVAFPLLAIGLLAGYRFWQCVLDWFWTIRAEGLREGITTIPTVLGEMQHLMLGSSFKYIVLILMEIMIFHAVRKTLAILSKAPLKPVGVKVFLAAQWRMLIVGVYVWIIEMIVTLFIGLIATILGIALLKPILVFLLQAFLLGFTMIDNFNEFYYKLNIRKSIKSTQQIVGVAIPIGIVVYILLLIPLVGAVAASLVGAVAASLTLFDLETRRKANWQTAQSTEDIHRIDYL